MEEKAIQLLGWNGRMISGSKSGYSNRNPKNIAVFNANIVIMSSVPVKIWYGDLDITLDIDKLKELALETGQTLCVLREMDARFENENSPKVTNFIIKIEPDGSYELGSVYQSMANSETLTLK